MNAAAHLMAITTWLASNGLIIFAALLLMFFNIYSHFRIAEIIIFAYQN